MSLIYGVESRAPADTLLTNGYDLYTWVMRKSCYPSFWGRTLVGKNPIEDEEIEFLKSKNCKIALIVRDLSEATISSNTATEDAIRAIEAARRLGIPRNNSIALFAEIPDDFSVNHNWMINYARNLLNNGYLPGFIGNTDSSKNFNFGRQCSHYVQATRNEGQLCAVYCSTQPKYQFDPESFATYAPSELLPKDINLWNYGNIDFHKISVGKLYASSAMVLDRFWPGEKGEKRANDSVAI